MNQVKLESDDNNQLQVTLHYSNANDACIVKGIETIRDTVEGVIGYYHTRIEELEKTLARAEELNKFIIPADSCPVTPLQIPEQKINLPKREMAPEFEPIDVVDYVKSFRTRTKNTLVAEDPATTWVEKHELIEDEETFVDAPLEVTQEYPAYPVTTLTEF